MDMKQHLTMKGLQEIVNIRASMNSGLSDKLEKAFPKTAPPPPYSLRIWGGDTCKKTRG